MCIIWSCEAWYTIVVTYPRNNKCICTCTYIYTMYHLRWDILTWMAVNKTTKRLYASPILAASKTSWPPQELLTSNAHKTACSSYANELIWRQQPMFTNTVRAWFWYLCCFWCSSSYACLTIACVTGWAVKSDTINNIAGVLNVMINFKNIIHAVYHNMDVLFII